MRAPGFTAERSLNRSHGQYTSTAAASGDRPHVAVMSDLSGWCCAGSECSYCSGSGACIAGSGGTHCVPTYLPARDSERTAALTDLSWPYHCLSGDHTSECYGQTGCFATEHEAACG
ncbi:hypothetical protein Slala03_81600 [Streptomyces lavendulae subsp. lavendulae]|nr:hypothetical protein Slala03_81600 [Streptomyces lavendulae subsp. lavendulae]